MLGVGLADRTSSREEAPRRAPSPRTLARLYALEVATPLMVERELR